MVGILPAAKQDVDFHFVAVFKESAGLLDLEFDVVVARLGAQADFLDLLLMLLGALRLLLFSARI